MKPKSLQQRRVAFTLVEMLVALCVIVLVGGICYYVLTAGAVLYAKNYSINSSGANLQAAIDRVNSEVSQATAMPQLVTLGSGGTFTTSTTSPTSSTPVGPAAGIIFDKYIGGPFILDSSGTATSTSFTLKVSTNSLVVSPLPQAGDVLIIDGAPSNSRAKIASATAGTISGGLQSYSVSLATGNTTGVAWVASDKKTSKLLRKVAFIVVGNELRYYPSMEGVTSYTTSSYAVLTSDIGTSTGEGTPFSLVVKNSQSFLNLSFRSQTRDYNQLLANKESKEQTTSFRIDTRIRPRNAL